MALRDHIKEKHDLAEKHPFVKLLFAGGVSPSIYAEYLLNQYLMYNHLEQLAEVAGLLNGVETVKRAESILTDFKELNCQAKVFKTSTDYIQYLNTISKEKLMAHIYVRHFGDLFGGQLMKKVVPGSGSMYNFENRSALIQELRSRLNDDLAEEANIALDWALKLFSELANEHGIQ